MDIEALGEQFCRELRNGLADAMSERVIAHPLISENLGESASDMSVQIYSDLQVVNQCRCVELYNAEN